MEETLTVEVGSWSAPAVGPGAASHRTLVLTGSALAKGAEGLFALIDADEERANQVSAALERAFARGGAADTLLPANAESYIAQVLEQVADDPHLVGHQTGVVLALWAGQSVLVAFLDGGRAYLCHDTEVVDVAPLPGRSPAGSRAQVVRVTLGPTDCLVLLGAEAAPHVRADELRQTVRASLSVDDAATWLATLATGRGAHNATVLVIQFLPRRTAAPALFEAPPSRRWYLLRLGGLAAAIILLLGVAVFLGSSLWQRSTASALQAPTGLRATRVTATRLSLSWLPVAGAHGYLIHIGGQEYRSQVPHLALTVPPGRHRWWVQATFGNQIGPSSDLASVRVPQPVLAAPVVLKPVGTYPARAANRITFCWRAATAAQQFDLFIVGRNRSLHLQLTRSEVSMDSNGSLCITRALSSGASYAWRLGAKAPGYPENWAPWHYFWVAAPKSYHAYTQPHLSKKRQHAYSNRVTRRVTRPRKATGAMPTVVPVKQSSPPYSYVPPTAPPAPVYTQPTSPPPAVYTQPTSPPPAVYTHPTSPPAPVYIRPTTPPRPTPTPIYVPVPNLQPTPAPTQPILACSNPPNCS